MWGGGLRKDTLGELEGGWDMRGIILRCWDELEGFRSGGIGMERGGAGGGCVVIIRTGLGYLPLCGSLS